MRNLKGVSPNLPDAELDALLVERNRRVLEAELARRMNITRNGVNSWEQGLSMPSPACLVDLSKVFSVSTDYLLGVERLETVNVTGLDEKDVAMLAQLADRLRETR